MYSEPTSAVLVMRYLPSLTMSAHGKHWWAVVLSWTKYLSTHPENIYYMVQSARIPKNSCSLHHGSFTDHPVISHASSISSSRLYSPACWLIDWLMRYCCKKIHVHRVWTHQLCRELARGRGRLGEEMLQHISQIQMKMLYTCHICCAIYSMSSC